MAHLVLAGDSIFDNARYTEGGPPVIVQVREFLPAGWQASLLAVDGATAYDVLAQVKRVPNDASYLVLSVGGNDAIMNADVLRMPTRTSSEAVSALADASEEFERDYRRTVEACRQLGIPLVLCTIYNGYFSDKVYQRLISTALMVFNDVILRVGFEFGLTLIDLRAICSSARDYANPIEPNSIGGAKIARCIAGVVSEPNTRAYARVVTG